jgi:aryl-alcohol dehydrogenase-like predicted oxidoreductase
MQVAVPHGAPRESFAMSQLNLSEQRTLGRSGLRVGSIGLGCMGMSWGYGAPGDRDEGESIRVIHRALELGCNLIDTADMYGPFHNEQLVGRALTDRREEAVVATKCGLVVVDPATGRVHPDGRPMHIKMACDASLSRLGVDIIDLYQLHRPDPTVPLADSIGAMAELVKAGKVRAIGVSELSITQLDEANAITPIATVQSELSLWSRDALSEILPWCVANDVAYIPFSPLGRGYLTGTLAAGFHPTDFRSRNSRFTDDAMAANQAIVAAVDLVAAELGCSTAQVAIAWTLSQGHQVVPIPGTKRVAYLEDNLAAAKIDLTPEHLAALDKIPAAVGSRY